MMIERKTTEKKSTRGHLKKMRKNFFHSKRAGKPDFDREFNSLFDSIVLKVLAKRWSVEKSILQPKN